MNATRLEALPVLNPHAAGIDVGSDKMFVSVAGGPPRVFGGCTADLRQVRDWLQDKLRRITIDTRLGLQHKLNRAFPDEPVVLMLLILLEIQLLVKG